MMIKKKKVAANYYERLRQTFGQPRYAHRHHSQAVTAHSASGVTYDQTTATCESEKFSPGHQIATH